MAAANLPIITPGLWVPDPCFKRPLGDVWKIGSAYASVMKRVPDPDANAQGTALRIQCNGLGPWPQANEWMESDYTPYGVGLGPYATAGQRTFSVFLSVRSTGVTNSGAMIGVSAIQLNSAGVLVASTSSVFTISGLNGLTTYTLKKTTFVMTMHVDCRYVGLNLYFQDAGDTAPVLYISNIGIGLPVAGSSYDSLSTYYSIKPSFGNLGVVRYLLPAGFPNQVGVNESGGFLPTALSLSFGNLTLADKALLERALYFNKGVVGDSAVSVNYDQELGRAPSPILIAMDREGVKRFFYANVQGFPRISPASRTWWPVSGSRYETSWSVQEAM